MKRFAAFIFFFLFAHCCLGEIIAQSSDPPQQNGEVGRFSYADMEASYGKRKSFGREVPVGFVATIKLPYLASVHFLHSVIFHSELQLDKRASIVVLNEAKEIIFLEEIEARGGENRFQLAEPLRLLPGCYYVGYYIHSRGRQLEPVVLDGDRQAIEGVNFLSVIENQPTFLKLGETLEFEDFAGEKKGNLAIAVEISGAAVKDIVLVEDILGVATIKPGAKETLHIRIRNGGVSRITSLELVLRDGKSEKRVTYECAIAPGEKDLLAIEYQFLQESKEGELVCSIASVNGKEHTLALHCVSFPYRIEQPGGVFALENVLLEYFTTENCGSCPQGSKTLAKLTDRLVCEGYQVAQVAHHTAFGSDPYTLVYSEQLVKYFFLGNSFTPALVVNRLPIGKDEEFAIAVSSQLENELIERLKRQGQEGRFDNITLDSYGVRVSGKVAINDKPPHQLRLHLLITEDSIATNRQRGANGIYYHRYVARRFLTPLEGVVLSHDGVGAFSFSLPLGILPDLWRREQLRLVAFVTDGLPSKDTGQVMGRVLFSKAVPFTEFTDATLPRDESIELTVSDGRLAICGEYQALYLYKPDGSRISPQQRLQSGVYIAKVVTTKGVLVVKIFVE